MKWTKLKDLKPNTQNINIKAKIVKIFEPIKVLSNKTLNEIQLQNIRITDDSIKGKSYWLVLWGEHVGKFAENDKIKIQNAYITSYDGQLQIRLMKNSTIKKVT